MYKFLLLFQLYTIGVFAEVIMTIKIVPYAPIILLQYLLYGLILAFGFYCWDVVYSVYRDLKKEENETALPMKFTNNTYEAWFNEVAWKSEFFSVNTTLFYLTFYPNWLFPMKPVHYDFEEQRNDETKNSNKNTF